MTLTAVTRILTACNVPYLSDPDHTYALATIHGDNRNHRPDRVITMYPASWSLRSLRLWLEAIGKIRTLPTTEDVTRMIKLQEETHAPHPDRCTADAHLRCNLL